MKARVVSLKGIEYEGDIASCNVKTTSGEITVLDHHLPLITVLADGPLKIVGRDGSRFEKRISSGFLEVYTNNQAHLLVS